MNAQVLVLDFGSQYTQLIARAVRELGVYCEVLPGNASAERILSRSPKALILSGGPASVRVEGAPRLESQVMQAGLPMFCICYGMQLVAQEMGGNVEGWARSASGNDVRTEKASDATREFGHVNLRVIAAEGPLSCFKAGETVDVWMSHGDKVTVLPPGFEAHASSDGSPIAAFGCSKRRIYGVQFHPEVHHTPRGKEILSSFLFDVAGLARDWDAGSFVHDTIERIRAEVPTGNVVCALSGGVDSTVAAVLVHKAIGARLHCIFVDNGLLRENEAAEVPELLHGLGLNIKTAHAAKQFLTALEGVTDPEKKRKIIGHTFIDVFEEEAHHITDVTHLVQGTLYPDVIESVSVVGQSATIKSHHNVGGLKDVMKLKLIEPLRELFKDEVRMIGRALEIPEATLMRQPFPGPGLAVRCLGDLTEPRLAALRKADKIVQEEVGSLGQSEGLWQWFAVLLPVRSVGVMGDGRTFDETIAIRVIKSRDGMTADWHLLPEPVVRRIANRIVNETPGVNRVVYDISSKPPATIEWE